MWSRKHLYRSISSRLGGTRSVVVPAEVWGTIRTCTGASAVVLTVPGADCADKVGKYGISDDRTAVPLEGREATLKGVLLLGVVKRANQQLSFPFVGSLSSSAPTEDRSALVMTWERCTRRRACS
jgi:hypothetical protein